MTYRDFVVNVLMFVLGSLFLRQWIIPTTEYLVTRMVILLPGIQLTLFQSSCSAGIKQFNDSTICQIIILCMHLIIHGNFSFTIILLSGHLLFKDILSVDMSFGRPHPFLRDVWLPLRWKMKVSIVFLKLMIPRNCHWKCAEGFIELVLFLSKSQFYTHFFGQKDTRKN